MGRKGGKLLLQMLLAAGRAFEAVRFTRAANQFLELGSTIVTTVFVYRHGNETYSNNRLQMPSITARTPAAGP